METTHSYELLRKFVKHELTQIEKPENPGQVYRFTDPERLVKVLCDFLRFPVDEPTVGRLESAFWNAVEPLLAEDLAVKSLPDCVEKLATTFESFLKKIGFLRYRNDSIRWSGDGANYVGLVNTTLADLTRGLVGKTKAGEPAVDLSAPIIDARGTKGAIYGKVREVRNNVHRAQDYSLVEIITIVNVAQDTRWEEPVILMAGFLPKKEQLIQILCRINLLLAAKCVAPLRAESSDIWELVRRNASEHLNQACNDVSRQGWTKIPIRETVGAVAVLGDEAAIRHLCRRLPSFSPISFDNIFGGLILGEKDLLHRIFLDADIFDRISAGQKGDYLLQLWLQIVEDVSDTIDIQRAIELCARVRSIYAVQVACAFDPKLALQLINPFSLHFSAKSLRKLFSLVNVEKHSAFLKEVMSDQYNPLRFSAALRLAEIGDVEALMFLTDRCIRGETFERGSAMVALVKYGKNQVSKAALLLLSQGTIALHQLVAAPIVKYIEFDEQLLRGAPAFCDYFASLLASGVKEQTRFALNRIVKLGIGDMLRKPLVGIIRPDRLTDLDLSLKQQMRIYEALKGQRFRGVIMLLDPTRGIGSIWCGETHHFYFLHQNEIWDSVPAALYDTVEFEVATGRKPKKDFEAIKVTMLPEKRIRGTIKMIEPERRFGLINIRSNQSPMFFYFDNVMAALSQISVGATVSFIVVPRLKETQSSQAVRVQLA